MLIGRVLTAILAACVVCCASPALSLDPALSIAQYKHTRWTVDDGAPSGIQALAQGRDGYLWIGASEGLSRFDGVTFESIAPERQIGDRSMVTALLAARDGSIWVGYAAGGVARYAVGVLRDAGVPHPTENVQQLVQTRDGAIWGLLGRSERPLVRFFRGRWVEIGEEWGLPAVQGVRLLVARDGTLWFSATRAIYSLRARSSRFAPQPFVPIGNAALAEDRQGVVWADDQVSARTVNGRKAMRFPYLVPGGQRGRRAIFDRDGNFWGSSDGGVFKIRRPDPRGEPSAAAAAAKVDRFRQDASLTSDAVRVVFEDREGVLWVGTSLGLDRFRPAAIVAEPLLTSVPQWGSGLLAASNGDVFFGQRNGVFRAHPGSKPALVLDGLGETETMCEAPDGAVWIVLQQRIVRFRDRADGQIGKPATRQAITDCAVGPGGTLFLTAGEGVFMRVGKGWQLHALSLDDETGGAMPIIALRNGKLLTYASSRSLRLYDPPRYTDVTLRRPAALRQLRTIYQARDAILLGGRFGLARWRGGHVDFLGRDRLPAAVGTTGIVSTPQGSTWVMARSGIGRIATADLDRAFDTPGFTPSVTQYDFRDGLPGVSHLYGKRDAVRGGDGRLWFATSGGTVWVDPAHVPRNTLAPPVAIAALHINGTRYRDPTTFSAKPGAGNVAIDFSALSLGIPERVRVLYQMVGVDDGWVEAGSARRASYTHLSPGQYRFHVIAANEDGVWNRAGASLDLTIRPTFLQSNLFLALCAAASLVLLWAAYSVRTRQLTERVRDRLEAQLSERERIARELHDTLLQGFQGLILRFQSVANRTPRDSVLRAPIDAALEHAESILTEGRDRVSDLRFADSDTDLASAIVDIAAKLDPDHVLAISVTVDGQVRPLVAMVREELLRIAREAIGNAVQHSAATHIAVTARYDRHVQLSVRDDGTGLPTDIASTGSRSGHYGLVGMRERAERAGGRFTIVSVPGQGTEVCVTVPGRLAYFARSARA